jgi:hypothetical protein
MVGCGEGGTSVPGAPIDTNVHLVRIGVTHRINVPPPGMWQGMH